MAVSLVQASQPTTTNQEAEVKSERVIGYVTAEDVVSNSHLKLSSLIDEFGNEMRAEFQQGLQEVKIHLEDAMQLMAICHNHEMQLLKDEIAELRKKQDTTGTRRDSDIADLQELVKKLISKADIAEEKEVKDTNDDDDLEVRQQQMEERVQKRRSTHLDLLDALEKMKEVVKNNPFHVERYDTGISMGSHMSVEGATIDS